MAEIPMEIERKFLIEYPSEAALLQLPGANKTEITQTYLTPAPDGAERRVRKRGLDGCFTYTCTEKIFLTPVRRVERERCISEAEYEALLKERNPKLRTLYKTRYAVPFEGLICEIDVYPHIADWAVMEIEFQDESMRLPTPPFVKIIREVTGVKEYSNAYLAGGNEDE